MPEKFASGIEDNTAKKMVGLLNECLAETVDLTLAVKQAHWNVKGQNFIGVHELLDEVADRLRDISDEMAERAVVLGGVAKGTSQVVSDASPMEAYPVEETDIKAHLDALTDRLKALGGRLRKAIDTAGEAGDEDTADLLTGASRTVDKDAWFIGANRPN
ncbi:DNA starvation/stationary phase protection protein Dps [Roseovarius sp. SCSIO 43702]|uniref:DNA starvation/stationary phase protection protein Dps n=1 Tax=Roseovarius sp. SCSIO 43702 TaxID=2823043 RepID=UPI001C73B8EB|nr:DNA starvation/stationary phase protection protein Dps [Roseovarius sp. SCSIO 43702]QYX56132.1 DNA starvation/stationary phase protection protein Dps [Roseovarius sp. SCSIO 43702]